MKFSPPKVTTLIRTTNTPVKGELLFDTDLDKLFIGDGITLGGIEVGNKSQNVATSVLLDGANISIDASLSNVYKVVLEGNRVLDNPTNLVDGQRIMLIVIQDSVGGRTLSFGSNYKFPSGSTNVLSTNANAIDIFDCVSDGTNMYCTLLKNYI